MRCLVSIFLAVFIFVCPISSHALESRKPDEVINLLIKSTEPTSVRVAISTVGEVAVWFDYGIANKGDNSKLLVSPEFKKSKFNMYKEPIGVEIGYTARKFQLYAGQKLLMTESKLENIPRYESVGIYQFDLMHRGMDVLPQGHMSASDKLRFANMEKFGFKNNEFVIDPGGYYFIWARAIGMDKEGFLYVAAEGSAYKKDPERMLFKINKEGAVADSFTYARAHRKKMFVRDLWAWEDDGVIQLDRDGNFYSITWPRNHHYLNNKIVVKRWASKK